MLEELHVARLGVVGDATLTFGPGLNVLTGETGAGKTLITVGLALALGSRASQGMIGAGGEPVAAEARFRVRRGDAETDAWIDDEDVGGLGAELVVARTVGPDGRSAARIGGKLAPVAALSALAPRLVEIHGQHQADRLVSPAAQLEFLDRFLGPEHVAEVDRYRAGHTALRRARAALEDLHRRARERERERDLLEYQIREIEGANVSPGEMAALRAEEGRLDHAERIAELGAAAEHAIGADEGAADRLRTAVSSLHAIATLAPDAVGLAERAASVAAETEDVLGEIRRFLESSQLDPARLQEVRERVQALRALERKYGHGEEGIRAYLDEARARLTELRGDDEARAALEDEAAALDGAVRERASRLSAGRRDGASRLAAALQAEVVQLGMPGASVHIEVTPHHDLSADGAEAVEFRFAGGAGQPALPLAKAASGGELSRVMLACRSVLANLDDVPTLVFDEVDAGIGGRTAHAVANRLADWRRRVRSWS
ncbi:MAG: DNA repair protein RecN [Actinomycetota bacterium]